VLIVQITDTHIRRKGDLLHHMVRTGRELRRCIAAINALPAKPAFVVATGDLVDRGKTKEYRRLHKILAGLMAPCFLLPGNHDDRDGLRDAFPEHRYLPTDGPLCYAIETRPVRLIALDTTRAGKPGGELDGRRLEWLDDRLLEAPATPTIIAMHHPPFATGIGPLDSQPLKGRDALAEVIAAHPQVVRLIAGHVHRDFEAPFAGTVASTAPSTAHQDVIDRDEDRGWTLRLERPAFALHRWTGRNLVTTVHRVADEPLLRAVS
jgi:3',5'-cyclic AMP phosphodiesterase CpdA